MINRVESFIEHQDACHMGRLRPTDHHNSNITQPLGQQQRPVACLSRTTSSSSPSNDTAVATATWQTGVTVSKTANDSHNLDLQLSVSPKATHHCHDNQSTQLQLSIGSSDVGDKNEMGCVELKEHASEQLRLAMADKEYAEEARREAKRQVELAEREFANAKRIRQQAQAELDKAYALKENSMKQISSTLLQITCHACKQQFQVETTSVTAITLLATSSIASLAESHVQKDDSRQ